MRDRIRRVRKYVLSSGFMEMSVPLCYSLPYVSPTREGAGPLFNIYTG